MRHFFSKFFYVIEGKHKELVFMLFLFVFTSLLEVLGVGMVGPFIALATSQAKVQETIWLKNIYSWLGVSSEYQFLIFFGVAILIIFYVKSLVTFLAGKKIFEFGFSQQAELCYRLMKAYLAAPYTFHLNRNSAAITQNISKETERFANGLMMPLLSLVSNSLVTLALIGLLIRADSSAMLIISLLFLATFTIVNSLKYRLKRWGENGSEASTGIIRSINHGLGGLKETKVIGCESYFEDQLLQDAQKFGTNSALAVSFSNLPRYMIESLLMTFVIAFTIFSVSINQDSSQNLAGVLGVFALASVRMLPAVSGIANSINSIRTHSVSLDKIYFDLKELESAKNKSLLGSNIGSKNPKDSIAFNQEISLSKVIYQYPNSDRNSLCDISLTIRKGQSVGLIGKSGAGKTTLVDVILGLLIPQLGDIKVDGASIYKNIRGWQNIVGYVPQSIFLIDGSLSQNIAFGVLDHLVDHERLLKAVEAAQLTELVQNLPQGLETKVGERGVLLSGGQRQRVGIARALYHEREVLVFDEATAALDNETEALVTESIRSLSGIKTMIIIAHRLSTIEHCDQIYMLEYGKVIRSGEYSEVVLNN